MQICFYFKKNSDLHLRKMQICFYFNKKSDLHLRKIQIYNDSRKNASHIFAIPQKDQSQLRLIVVVNKTQTYLVNTRCGTHYTPTHITQSIKLGYHNLGLGFQGVQGLGFRVQGFQGLGFRVFRVQGFQGFRVFRVLGFRFQGFQGFFRVQGLGFRFQGFRVFRVQDLGFRVCLGFRVQG